ncbi:hypothetical protein FGRMN_4511 [Fusarium graminum]|nr:hypothetical protein FGRMN_4511 [Fusarium graminum]
MTDHLLNLAKNDHLNTCSRTPTARSRGLREKAFVMSEAQYDAFKQRQWKQTVVPCLLVNGGKETVPERSWRQISATIFPPGDANGATKSCHGSSIDIQLDNGFRDTLNTSRERPPGVIERLLTEFEGPPGMNNHRQAAQPPIPTSFTTADDASTDFWTDQQTQLSTLINSHTGVDGQEDALSYGIGEAVEQDILAHRSSDDSGDQPLLDHLTGTGGGAANLESQELLDVYINFDAFNEQEDLEEKEACS